MGALLSRNKVEQMNSRNEKMSEPPTEKKIQTIGELLTDENAIQKEIQRMNIDHLEVWDHIHHRFSGIDEHATLFLAPEAWYGDDSILDAAICLLLGELAAVGEDHCC